MSVDPMGVDLLPLTLRKITDQRTISAAIRHQSEASIWLEPVFADLVLSLQAYVAVDHVIDEIVTGYSTVLEWESWWQHTKAVHFPTLSRWLRRPPRQVERRVSVDFDLHGYWAFPDADIYPVDLGQPIRITEARSR